MPPSRMTGGGGGDGVEVDEAALSTCTTSTSSTRFSALFVRGFCFCERSLVVEDLSGDGDRLYRAGLIRMDIPTLPVGLESGERTLEGGAFVSVLRKVDGLTRSKGGGRSAGPASNCLLRWNCSATTAWLRIQRFNAILCPDFDIGTPITTCKTV